MAQNDWSFVAGFDASTTKKGIYIFWKHPIKREQHIFLKNMVQKRNNGPKTPDVVLVGQFFLRRHMSDSVRKSVASSNLDKRWSWLLGRTFSAAKGLTWVPYPSYFDAFVYFCLFKLVISMMFVVLNFHTNYILKLMQVFPWGWQSTVYSCWKYTSSDL